MSTRGIRGANVVEANTSDEILTATKKLLEGVCEKNPSLQPGDIASIIFTVTNDLNAVHPALAARLMGWVEVPMLCGQEIPVPGSMPRCIRILIHWNTELAQNQIQHVYLGAAAALRPDLTAPIQNNQK